MSPARPVPESAPALVSVTAGADAAVPVDTCGEAAVTAVPVGEVPTPVAVLRMTPASTSAWVTV